MTLPDCVGGASLQSDQSLRTGAAISSQLYLDGKWAVLPLPFPQCCPPGKEQNHRVRLEGISEGHLVQPPDRGRVLPVPTTCTEPCLQYY